MKLLVMILFVSFSNVSISDELRLGYNSENVLADYAVKIYAEISQRISDLNIVLVDLPMKRSLVMANHGSIDGDAARIKKINDTEFKNLVVLTESILTVNIYTIRHPNTAKVNTLGDLVTKSVVFLRGVIFLESFFKSGNCYLLNQENDGIDLVKEGKFQYKLVVGYNGQIAIDTKKIQPLILDEESVQKLELFTVLNKAKADYGKKIEAAIREMKKDGTLYKLTENSLKISKAK